MAEESNDDQGAPGGETKTTNEAKAPKRTSARKTTGSGASATKTATAKKTPRSSTATDAEGTPKPKAPRKRTPKAAVAGNDEIVVIPEVPKASAKPKPARKTPAGKAKKAAETPAVTAVAPDTHEPWPESPAPVAAAPIESTTLSETTKHVDIPAVSESTDEGIITAIAGTVSLRFYVAAIALATFALGLTVGVVLGAVASDDSADQTAAVPAVVVPASSQPTTGEAQPIAPDQPIAEPAPQAGEQVTAGPGLVSSLSGGPGPRQSGIFALPDGPTKVKYTTTGSGLTVRLIQQGGNNGDSFFCSSACSREASLVKASGSYYLNVDAREGQWTVEVSN